MLLKEFGQTVMSGPFKGMKFHQNVSDGCYIPKLLGWYEAELHPYLSRFKDKNHTRILDIGCAEGYYAVGLAAFFPQAEVLAFDINPAAQNMAKTLAGMNGVEDKVKISGKLEREKFPHLINENTFILCDIEGAEYELLNTSGVGQALKKADIIVEIHNYNTEQNKLRKMLDDFKDTHNMQLVFTSGRNPSAFPFMRYMKHIDQLLCGWECREMETPWLILERKWKV